MHNLFNDPKMFHTGTLTLPGWNNGRKAIYDELNKLSRYFRDTSQWVKNNHPLVKLLKEDDTMLYENADNTIEIARDTWLSKAEMFGISTPYRSVSHVTNNICYPQNVCEYLVMDDSIPLGSDAKFNWHNLEPIRILDHPYDDLNMSIPNGKFIGTPKRGKNVFIAINIPILILQYRLWQKYEAERNGIDPESPHIFLSRYPLFNVVNSHMDIVLRNRFIAHYLDLTLEPFKQVRSGGVAINDVSNYVDRSLLSAVTNICKGRYTLEEVNLHVPQLTVNNVADSLLLPEMTYTRSVRWAYDASRINWLEFLVQYNQDHPSEKNRNYLDYMRRRIRSMRNNKEFIESIGIGSDTTYGKLCNLLEV